MDFIVVPHNLMAPRTQTVKQWLLTPHDTHTFGNIQREIWIVITENTDSGQLNEIFSCLVAVHVWLQSVLKHF